MNAHVLAEIQERIVVAIANAIEGAWDCSVINIEINVVDGERTENCLAISFRKENGRWESDGFKLPIECYDLFVQLRESMNESTRGYWKSCTLEIGSEGDNRYLFSYDPPRRLNGIHDDVAMLKNYPPPFKT